jgi:8-oxo-dGTP diphosphatase
MPTTAPEAVIHVVAGLLERDARIFLTQRPAHAHLAGKWEFPGGKLDPGETPLAGLTRELHEEIGVDVAEAAPFAQVRHAYPDKTILLDVWRVSAWRGEPHGREGQAVRWSDPHTLRLREFPQADWPIVRRLQLPPLYLISDAQRLGRTLFLDRLARLLGAGVRLVQLREPELSPDGFAQLVREVAPLCREHGARLLVNANPRLAPAWSVAGAHLNASRLMACTVRPLDVEQWVAASCHNERELAHAGRLGVDFAVLSPVAATPSHPHVAPLGWERFQEWVSKVSFPVYALGGMQISDIPTARSFGAQGVALMRGVWDVTEPERLVQKLAGR